jgi:hypothetical protein
MVGRMFNRLIASTVNPWTLFLPNCQCLLT